MSTVYGNIIHLSALGSLPSGTPITTVTVMQKHQHGATPYDVTFRGDKAATLHDDFSVGDLVMITIDEASQRPDSNTSRRGVKRSMKAFGRKIEHAASGDDL